MKENESAVAEVAAQMLNGALREADDLQRYVILIGPEPGNGGNGCAKPHHVFGGECALLLGIPPGFEPHTPAAIDREGEGAAVAGCVDVRRRGAQEFIDGIPGRNLKAVEEAGLDRQILARRGAHAVLKMIVEDGFFHADPHPGNVFYLPGNRIAFIDFGMVGRLTEERRDQLTRVLQGLVKREPQRAAEVMLDWAGDAAVDEESLTLEVQTFVDQYHGVALKQLRIGAMLSDLVTILRQHRLTLPTDLALLVKGFITLEGMGCELDPDFDMAGEALPMLEHALRARYAPAALIKRGGRTTGETFALLADLPHDISRLLRAARRGRLELHIDVTHLKRLGNQLDRAANRLVVGIVVAALIIGSSIVMTVSGGPTLLGLPFFGLLGFLGAVAGGLWLLLSISKSGRADRE